MTKINRVLLVDDDSLIRELAEMSLQSVGMLTVCACESGELALEKINDFQPDIILLDSNMSGLDGPETLHAIRQLAPFETTPIVFFTGETRESEIEQLLQLGAIGVINKPFDPMSLTDQLKKICESPNE